MLQLLGLTVFLGLLGSLAGAVTGAAADTCPQPGSEIATDRPDTTNSSLVVPQGSFQQENGVNISRRDGGQVVDGTNTRLRFGIAHCLEVLVSFPTVSVRCLPTPVLGAPTPRPRANGRLARFAGGSISPRPS